MNDVEQQDSTVIDTEAAADVAPAHKTPETRDDAISKALDDAEAATKASEEADPDIDDAKPEKPEKAEKPTKEADGDEPEDDDKAEAAEDDEGEDDEEDEAPAKPERKKDRKAHPSIPAPAKLREDVKDQWVNVPHVLRGEIDRIVKEYEGEAEYYRPAVQRYNDLREYDELAASNGVDLRQTLADVKRLEDLMEANPLAALNSILLRSGPRKADGQPVSLFEFAAHVVQMGQEGYHKAITQMPQQQQRQPDPEVARLRDELASIKQDQVKNSVIAPFAAQNPRFNEPGIQQSIAMIMQSGMVSPSLPAPERLAAAYDMAVRLNPSADDEQAPVETQEKAAPRRVDGSGGSRSVKGAPPSGGSKGNAKRVMSRDDAINAAMAALR